MKTWQYIVIIILMFGSFIAGNTGGYEVGYAVGYEDGVFDEGWIYAQELHNLTANLTYSLDQHKIVASE